jgi:hypothetical protein
VDWIDLAQDRYRWRALVNTVMNLRVQSSTGKLPRAQLMASRVVLSSIYIYIYIYRERERERERLFI